MMNNTATDLTALATAIRERYMPLVFKCECAGQHDECRAALDSAAVWTQHDVVLRIANFIETYRA